MIEVGEYVRTKNKGIKKIDTIFENRTVNRYGYEIGSEWDGKLYSTIETSDIVKHSKNIIDLIEEGDYVNGYYCRYITDINTGAKYLCNYDLNEMRWIPLENIDIWDNILTKEQYEANCYKVKEEIC